MYEERLQKIIESYGYKAEPLVDSTMIFGTVMDIIHTCCNGKKLSIWGVGKTNTINSHAAVLISKYILELVSMREVIDSSPDLQGKDFMGYPIISPNQISEKGIEIVIIASRASAKSIRESLREVAPNCEYVDIYEELQNRGINIDYNFFSEQNVYTELYRVKENYEKVMEEQQKEILLKEMIQRYLQIKDFYYAKKYAKEYCSYQYTNYEDVVSMFKEIKSLLKEVKEKNQAKSNNIVIHLIDSLRAIDVYGDDKEEEMKMFKGYEKNAFLFKEAYSTGPTTYESMLGIVKQKLSFEENVYEDGNFMFSLKDFNLLQEIQKREMHVNFDVAKDYLIMEENNTINRKEHLHMCEKLWELACDVAEQEKPGFYFLYYPWELHFPLLCGFHRKTPQIRHFSDVGVENMEDFIESQFEDCIHYVDIQFEYYREFFSEEMVQVFLGDHSQPVFDAKKERPFFAYCSEPDKVSHVAFFIHSSKLKNEVCNELVSLLDFNTIIKKLVLKQEYDFPTRKIIQYQYYKIQNKKLRDVAIKKGLENYIDGIQCFLSKEYLYILTSTGMEKLYKRDKNIQRPIELEEGCEYIKKIQEAFDTSFPKFVTG